MLLVSSVNAAAIRFAQAQEPPPEPGLPNTFGDGEIAGETLDENFAFLMDRIAELQADNAVLQNFIVQVLPYLEGGVDAQGNPAVVFSGANVYINNGAGLTRSINGTGNLVIGYNEPEDPATADWFCSDGHYDNSTDCINNGETWDTSQKIGSHNLVVGPEHSYTKYGGLVAGWKNRVTGIFATVSGGRKNTARGHYTSISGGGDNIATASWAAVSGGKGNSATGFYASLSGGNQNTASGPSASISGGKSNEAGTFNASVSGGRGNTATGYSASVSGGYYNSAGGEYAVVSGGKTNTASGDHASVSAGASNTASGYASTVSGGGSGYTFNSYNWRAGNLLEAN